MKKIESTKCNKCISSGGGDCATCDPPVTTAQQEPEVNGDNFTLEQLRRVTEIELESLKSIKKICGCDKGDAREILTTVGKLKEHDEQVKKQERERVLKSAMCEVEVRKRQAHHDLVDAMEMILAAENAIKSLREQHDGNGV